jgi:hypothetical protein
MLKKLKGIIHRLKTGSAWICGAAAVVAIVWIVESSQSFQSCIKDAQYEKGEQSLQKILTDLSILIRWQKDCLGVFIDQNDGTITALATFLIALFTLTLWQSTNKLWDGAEKERKLSEDTAKRQLRAYVHVEDVIISLVRTEFYPLIQIIIKNFGATPARLIVNRCVCAPFPKEQAKFELINDSRGEIEDLAPTQQTYSTFRFPRYRWDSELFNIAEKNKNLPRVWQNKLY